jgi:hypothetical protein
MLGGNVTIKNTAQASVVVKAATVAALTKVEYTVKEFNKFEKSIVTIAQSVMSDHNGGKHGYAGLILETTANRTLLGSTTETFTEHRKPGRTASYVATATAGEIAMAKDEHLADREQYYTQAGVKEALKYLIINNVPAELLVEIEDDDTEFENVTPLEMMTHHRTNARVTDVFDKKQLLDALNEPVNFDGDLPLKGHFKNVDATIKLLKKHNITASESMVMVTILEQIKGHGDFKEEVIKWELKTTTSQTWIVFKKYFSAADHEQRQRDQYGAKTAGSVGATANHVTSLADLKTYIDENLLALAQATTAGINAVMDQPTPLLQMRSPPTPPRLKTKSRNTKRNSNASNWEEEPTANATKVRRRPHKSSASTATGTIPKYPRINAGHSRATRPKNQRGGSHVKRRLNDGVCERILGAGYSFNPQ